MSGYRPTVRRYTAAARLNHWVTAISLVLLAISGLGLFHPDLFFRFVKLNLPVNDDALWIKALPDVLKGHEEKLPEIGKYNAGQKLVFWGMTVLILVLVTSGVVIWDQYFFPYTSIEQKRIALLVHAVAAIGAMLIWIVHVYAAIWVRGTVSAMTTGSVTAGWAWRHHRKWLREEAAKERTSPRA